MYQIKNELGYADVFMYDEIGFEGITARDVVKQLKGLSLNNINIRINSSGGDLGEALGMYNYMKSLEVKKTVYIDGIAASAASIIAMCGDKVYMPESALMMIHNPWTTCAGDSEDMKHASEVLNIWKDLCVKIYSSKTGLSEDEIASLMDSETWMTGSEAKAKGFADEISGTVKNRVKDSYEAGVKAERERIRELDELMTPDREKVIREAKYETIKTAQDIAIELLKSTKSFNSRRDNYRLDSYELDGISAKVPEQDSISEGVKMMNRMRGYK